ncbi:MAG: hypothetical protein NT067_03585 [Candidatus Diapherotrites archaeon]|nr:hypothetical protein [Candidatus Diapherotrites archaeon]
MGKVGKKAGFSFLVFALILLGIAVFAAVPKCAGQTGFDKDDCIEANAVTAQDCAEIFSISQQENCILRVAKEPNDCELISNETTKWQCVKGLFPALESLADCTKLPSKYLSKCEAFVTFQNNPEDISVCWKLKYDSQEYCVEEYVTNRKISDPNFCLDVKEDFQARCAYLATLNKYGFGAVLGETEKGACDTYTGKIKDGCEQYFAFSSAANGAIGGFLTAGLIFFAAIVIFGLAAIVIVIYVLTRKKGQPEKPK